MFLFFVSREQQRRAFLEKQMSSQKQVEEECGSAGRAEEATPALPLGPCSSSLEWTVTLFALGPPQGPAQ